MRRFASRPNWEARQEFESPPGCVYLIQIDHIVYEKRGGASFTLPEAMRALYGTGNARVLREDGTVVVSHAGSAYSVTHEPSAKVVRRGRMRI
jgi:hypothetical protein